MKKHLIFAPIMLVVAILLCLLKKTGMPVHIAVSLVGAVALVGYTVTTKKEWKIPALEIAMRASYGIALITGIVLKIKYLSVVGVFHKVFALLFIVGLIAIFVNKLIETKKA